MHSQFHSGDCQNTAVRPHEVTSTANPHTVARHRYRHSFRGGRKGLSSTTGPASIISADGSGNSNADSLNAPCSGRDKNKFDSRVSGDRGGSASAESGGRGCASSSGGGGAESGGSSGVSFVLKNKKQAARASRWRLTEEQVRMHVCFWCRSCAPAAAALLFFLFSLCCEKT